jgi:hypothetical protein
LNSFVMGLLSNPNIDGRTGVCAQGDALGRVVDQNFADQIRKVARLRCRLVLQRRAQRASNPERDLVVASFHDRRVALQRLASNAP